MSNIVEKMKDVDKIVCEVNETLKKEAPLSYDVMYFDKENTLLFREDYTSKTIFDIKNTIGDTLYSNIKSRFNDKKAFWNIECKTMGADFTLNDVQERVRG